jgi:hypothetical protein
MVMWRENICIPYWRRSEKAAATSGAGIQRGKMARRPAPLSATLMPVTRLFSEDMKMVKSLAWRRK